MGAGEFLFQTAGDGDLGGRELHCRFGILGLSRNEGRQVLIPDEAAFLGVEHDP